MIGILTFGISNVAFAETSWKIMNVTSGMQNFKIPYKITNGTLQTINYDTQSTSLLIYIKTTHTGILEITIPKDLINSQSAEGRDAKFYILKNGVATDYWEYNGTNCFRILSIKFNSGSKIIEIPMSMMPPAPVRSYVPPLYIATKNINTSQGARAMMISGCTDLNLNDKQLILNVTNSQGQAYKTISIIPDINGSFSTTVPIEDNSSSNTIYLINATYAGHSTTETVTVPEFSYLSTIVFIIAVLIIITITLPSKLNYAKYGHDL